MNTRDKPSLEMKILYTLVARLDDDPLIERRTQEHAHQLRQEIQNYFDVDMDQYLPGRWRL